MIIKYLIGTGLLNINTYNKKFIRNDKNTRLLLSDRLIYLLLD